LEKNQQINHLKATLYDGLYNLYPTLFIFLLAIVLKVIQKVVGRSGMEYSFGNIFMLQDVISLKPNVISAVYMEWCTPGRYLTVVVLYDLYCFI
jgi:hypothetical protein